MMNLANERVKHRQFGEGQVVENTEDRITVQFGKQIGLKSFIFPDAFENFLLIDKLVVQHEIHKIYEQKIEQERKLQQERMEKATRLAAEQAKNPKTKHKKTTSAKRKTEK
ncbi:hypothetical protein NYE49_12950 [Bacillus sp. FSL L8-0358]|uniref:hypothetical protein n=2 Tax=unclassified Bacillus (in: firmicutes) TaxID=185979 RepID=UPI003157F547